MQILQGLVEVESGLAISKLVVCDSKSLDLILVLVAHKVESRLYGPLETCSQDYRRLVVRYMASTYLKCQQASLA